MNRDRLDFGNEKIGRLFRAMFFPTLTGMLFNSVLNLCDGMFLGHGVGSNALAAVNIVLDWVMVFPLAMELKGAAIATSISCIVSGLMVLCYFLFFSDKLKFYRLRLSVKSLRLSLRNTGYMLKIGMATFIAELSVGIMMVIGNFQFMDYLGEVGVAAYSVGCYLFPLIFSINNAVAQSAQPILSYNYGADNRARVSRTLRVALGAALICGAVITLAMWTGTPLLAAVFLSPADAAYGLAVKGLPLLGTCAVFFALNITFIGYYQSLERAGRSIACMLLRGVIFLVPAFMLLPRLLGVDGLWLAITASEAATLAAILVSRLKIVRESRK